MSSNRSEPPEVLHTQPEESQGHQAHLSPTAPPIATTAEPSSQVKTAPPVEVDYFGGPMIDWTVALLNTTDRTGSVREGTREGTETLPSWCTAFLPVEVWRTLQDREAAGAAIGAVGADRALVEPAVGRKRARADSGESEEGEAARPTTAFGAESSHPEYQDQDLYGYSSVPATALDIRIPNPQDIERSFYPTRRGAIAGRRYGMIQHPITALSQATESGLMLHSQTKLGEYENGSRPPTTEESQLLAVSSAAATDETLVIAVDHNSGLGAKQFNVLRRSEISDFVFNTEEKRRNYYVVIDPSRPVDPFFDLDGELARHPELAARIQGKNGDATKAFEEYIVEVIPKLVELLTNYFSELESRVSTQPELLHAQAQRRLSQRLSTSAAESPPPLGVADLHGLEVDPERMSTLSAESTAAPSTIAGAGTVQRPPLPPPQVESILVLQSCSDKKWSAHLHFRMNGGRCFDNIQHLNHFVQERIASAVAAAFLATGEEREPQSAGAGAPVAVAPHILSCIDCAIYSKWRLFRLPFCGKRLGVGESGPALLPWCPEQQDSSAIPSLPIFRQLDDRATIFDQSFIMLDVKRAANHVPMQVVEHLDHGEAFADAPRVPATLAETKLGREVFSLLSPEYAGKISRCHMDYEDNGKIRQFRVVQRSSKYCLKAQRHHQNTFPHLHLTYGSIKVRCWSNDCYERCHRVPWTQSDRLREIRDLLFPPLPEDELRRRYASLGRDEENDSAPQS